MCSEDEKREIIASTPAINPTQVAGLAKHLEEFAHFNAVIVIRAQMEGQRLAVALLHISKVNADPKPRWTTLFFGPTGHVDKFVHYYALERRVN